jgi:hypothetical protein
VLPVVSGGTGVTTSTGTGSTVLSDAPTLTGNVNLSTGNLVIGTSGKGIDFSATAGTGTSELLADYEEGTFTPTLLIGGSSVGITYDATNSGSYTKVGRMVTINGLLVITNKGGLTGSVVMNGFPFTSSSTVGNTALSIGGFSNISYTGQLGASIGNSITQTVLWKTTEAGVRSNLQGADLTNTSFFFFHASYFV